MKKEIDVLNVASSDNVDCCQPSQKINLSNPDLLKATESFAALADEVRLGILHLLAQSESEVCVCDITANFKQGQPTISHHLKILREAGFITSVKRGKWVYYSLVSAKLKEVQPLLETALGITVLV